MAKDQAVRAVFHVYGIVQGVGFRPFVARLAGEHSLPGSVRNVSGHVIIEAVGAEKQLALFAQALRARKPPGSLISDLRRQVCPIHPGEAVPDGFAILDSGETGEGPVMPPPDIATCDACLAELFSPGDPRRHNPFVSCTHCGPRFSILRSLPYDRKNTSMEPFPLCPLCAAQYADPGDRRYHAQTVCCNACGPTLRYQGRGEGEGASSNGSAALAEAAAALRRGEIVALKGIGGYHLTCSPFDEAAVQALRSLKGREHKPFAVMFPSLASLKEHCRVSDTEASLLESPARPIVLLRSRPSPIAERVYTGSPNLGAFLPYTPLQHLILRETGPLVMTSANASSLPIIKDDGEMLRFLEDHEELSGALFHDRPILRRLDDSVAVVMLDEPCLLRRARGCAPMPLPLTDGPPVLACGAQEKNTVCLSQRGYAYPSAEIGDLDSRESAAAYRETISDMQALLRIAPELAVCDEHPGYASTAYALDSRIPVLRAQHHHAHIASVMAEHGLNDPVIGVAFDGTGYGSDGSIWGGEFLLVSPGGFSRAGHLKAVTMLAGDESVRQGWKSAACLLHDAGVDIREDERLLLIHAALAHGIHTVRSSSMGRVFDGISAMLGICRESRYGGQCAIELENAADACADGGVQADPFPFRLTEDGGRLVADLAPCVREIHARYSAGESRNELAWRFHVTVSELILVMCNKLAQRHGVRDIALSGGVFANRLLVERTVPRLRQAGFAVYRNQRVPPGDGGISLGQALIGLWSAQRKESTRHVHSGSRKTD